MIKRRDFIAGCAVAGSALGLTPRQAFARGLLDAAAVSGSYPPALTGLRGSHDGAFEAAHDLALQGRHWTVPGERVDPAYDLVVVGAGISGLAAAWFYRQQAGPAARILLLDNHDDFGGHARRNEFRVDGRLLLGYGGSQSLEAPAYYGRRAAQLLDALGVETARFERYYDRGFAGRHGLGALWYFDAAHYGVDRLLPSPLPVPWLMLDAGSDAASFAAEVPLPPADREALLTLLTSERDWLAGLDRRDRHELLRRLSYDDFLRRHAGMPETVVSLLRRQSEDLWGLGYDALSTLEAGRSGMPGTAGLGLWNDADEGPAEPYIHHFPDGNATIARLLLRRLLPHCADGSTMEDIVLARVAYGRLDDAGASTRLRLNATAIDVRHADGGAAVDVSYVRGGRLETVRGQRVVLACYNQMIPHICPELPAAQAAALDWAEKVPLVYVNVALRRWHACRRAGLYYFRAVQDFFGYGMLDFPVSMPGYRFSAGPDDPILMHLTQVPTHPGRPPREQHRLGRADLLGLSFSDYEDRLRRQLTGMLAPYGFDFEADVAAITVNRWPHGYAYEYNELYDPPDWGPDNGPHVQGRQPFGRVAIANSDSQAYAYVDGAIDAAWRAVHELQSGQS